jgi:hypothetical protein
MDWFDLFLIGTLVIALVDLVLAIRKRRRRKREAADGQEQG